MYDKKVAYLHYMKNGNLMGNAGHVKVTFRGSGMTMELFVRDMQLLPGGYYSIKGLGECSYEDKVHIEKGQAVYKKRLDADKCGKDELPFGIRIEIGKEEYIEAIWRAENKSIEAIWRTGNKSKSTEVQAAETTDSPEKKDLVQETKQERLTEERTWREGTVFAEPATYAYEKQKGKTPNGDVLSKPGKLSEMLTFSVPTEIYEDKWKELCKKYDVVHPFGDGEEYISICPKDFIIFPEKYQNLVNNSFLLHGYYNYRHIILGKKEEAGKNVYYLGVPGVYYEREKMVAIMFGFEGFECGEKKAGNGGFGYYMRRVEL